MPQKRLIKQIEMDFIANISIDSNTLLFTPMVHKKVKCLKESNLYENFFFSRQKHILSYFSPLAVIIQIELHRL